MIRKNGIYYYFTLRFQYNNYYFLFNLTLLTPLPRVSELPSLTEWRRGSETTITEFSLLPF